MSDRISFPMRSAAFALAIEGAAETEDLRDGFQSGRG